MPPFGVVLRQNHRACGELVNVVSQVFYEGQMVSFQINFCYMMNNEMFLQVPGGKVAERNAKSEEMQQQLLWVPKIGNRNASFIWVDTNGECQRNPTTHSLFNIEEANVVADLAKKIGHILGDENVLVLSPYLAQVNSRCYVSNRHVQDIISGSRDQECVAG